MFSRSLKEYIIKIFLQIPNVVYVDKQGFIQNTFFWLLYCGQICTPPNQAFCLIYDIWQRVYTIQRYSFVFIYKFKLENPPSVNP